LFGLNPPQGENPLNPNPPTLGNLIKYKSGEIISEGGGIEHYRLPCVSNRYQPLVHSFQVSQDKEGVPQTTNFTIKHSYGNIDSHYSDENLNIKFVFPKNYAPPVDKIYDDLKKIYITKEYASDATPDSPFGAQVPFKVLNYFLYSEKIFPKQNNTYLAQTRKRTKYAETASFDTRGFNRRDYENTWHDNILDRKVRTSESALNSQDATTAEILSVWSLDTSIPNREQNYARITGAIGELSTPLGFHSYEGRTGLTQMYSITASVNSFRFPSQHKPTEDDNLDQWARGVPNYATDLISGKRPFYDSYEDFAEDIRGLGKDYSILPEFRISDHMDYYINEKEGNFLSTNNAFLNLKWGNISSSAAQINESESALEQDFFVEYTNSDFMKYFGDFSKEHTVDIATINSYSFTMKGIKKLLPYRGFYPHQRALQLGTILSQSFGKSLTGSINESYIAPPTVERAVTGSLSAFLRPIISPGIVFNSLKSALAVDYPVFTGSIPGSRALIDSDTGLSFWGPGANPNYRLPFETAIEPQTYLPVSSSNRNKLQNLFFDDPTKIQSFNESANIAVSWTGDFSNLYSLAANNFFGEIPRFFLKDSKFTDFISAKQSEFEEVEEGKFYYMDVVLRKTNDMVLWEGQLDASSAPYSGSNERGMFYGPPVSSSWANDQNGGNIKDPAYAPYTPPYFYEESTARITYVATASGPVTLDELLSNTRINTYFTGSSAELGLNDTASNNKMKITGSVNLFGKSRYKPVTFDPRNINPLGGFEPTSLDDTSDGAFTAWSIGTKFECPALNFSASTDYHDTTTGRGLWGGYGSIPTGKTGLYISLKESFPDLIGTAAAENTGSLIQLCGFKAGSKKIGKVAPTKTISEAVVAIPFVYKKPKPGFATTIKYPNTDKRFFKIHLPKFYKAQKELASGTEPENTTSPSIANMIEKLSKYNMPPRYDFLTFPQKQKNFMLSPPGLSPFVVYVFEFNHTLSQQDLSDIWQGLMPNISIRAEEDEVVVSHRNNINEFFHGAPLPEDTRWMLFKVKRKAEKSYFAVTSDSTDDSRFKFNFGNEEKAPEYNYNWPYDFFSLVELVKMDANITFKPKQPIQADLAALGGGQGTAQAAPSPAAEDIPPGGLGGTI